MPQGRMRNFKGLQLRGMSAFGGSDSSESDNRAVAGTTDDDTQSSSNGPLSGIKDWLSPSRRANNIPSPLLNRSRQNSGEIDNSQLWQGNTSPNRKGLSYHEELSNKMHDLEVGAASSEPLDLSVENLETISELGAGNGGSVSKVIHRPTGIVMAKKSVMIDVKPEVRKQILRELQILHECRSSYIVGFYGASLSNVQVLLCMEYMDMGSLDGIYQKYGPIEVPVCGKVVVCVIHGLTYLYEVHRIIHRDVKPSNILVNGKGEIKLCDFGVSGELINSIADTFVGTSTYMSPERIQGGQYSIKSDVWSLGISLIEVAHGRFPFADEDGAEEESTMTAATVGQANQRHEAAPLSILELLQRIVYEPPPQLHKSFPPLMRTFVDACLCKDVAMRPTPMDLMNHEYVRQARAEHVSLADWVMRLRARTT
ncbi:mitogen-activated protein kinase kinase [Malassezia cuniculi]|uniref:Mitogen-activated protein kinase kinase n=1 Tax=Malassezia cuniculi TaxID=948313 RepID=A0AAF0EWU1_9BASI|nr:mitogen-activated protein kinase kinase [Malassezia cuniculi]